MRHAHFFRWISVVLATLAAISPSTAQTKIGNAQIMMVTGACEALTLGKQNFGSDCSAKVMSTSYPDGRVGFYFLIAGGRAVTVSGYDGDNPTPDTDVMTVDKVIVNLDATTPDKPDVFPAKGKCSYGNPYKGKMTISCKGKLQDGRSFSGIFTTDGMPPT